MVSSRTGELKTMPRLKHDDQEKRDEILRISRSNYEKSGRNFTLRPIWEEVGIGAGRFNRLFGSNEAIIAAITHDDHFALVREAHANLAGPPTRESFSMWTVKLVDTILHWPHLGDLLLEALPSPGSPLHPMAANLRHATCVIVDAKKQEWVAGVTPDGEMIYASALAFTSASEKICPGPVHDMIETRAMLTHQLLEPVLAAVFGPR